MDGNFNFRRNKSQEGGAVYNIREILFKKNFNFIDNISFIGGAIFNGIGEDYSNSNNEIENGIMKTENSNFLFSNNKAEVSSELDKRSGLGGAIYNESNNTLTGDFNFIENKASKGGAIYNSPAYIESFFGEFFLGLERLDGTGLLELTNGKFNFIKNKAGTPDDLGYGGAIYNDGDLILSNEVLFEENYAEFGDAVYNGFTFEELDGYEFRSNILNNEKIYDDYSEYKKSSLRMLGDIKFLSNGDKNNSNSHSTIYTVYGDVIGESGNIKFIENNSAAILFNMDMYELDEELNSNLILSNNASTYFYKNKGFQTSDLIIDENTNIDISNTTFIGENQNTNSTIKINKLMRNYSSDSALKISSSNIEDYKYFILNDINDEQASTKDIRINNSILKNLSLDYNKYFTDIIISNTFVDLNSFKSVDANKIVLFNNTILSSGDITLDNKNGNLVHNTVYVFENSDFKFSEKDKLFNNIIVVNNLFKDEENINGTIEDNILKVEDIDNMILSTNNISYALCGELEEAEDDDIGSLDYKKNRKYFLPIYDSPANGFKNISQESILEDIDIEITEDMIGETRGELVTLGSIEKMNILNPDEDPSEKPSEDPSEKPDISNPTIDSPIKSFKMVLHGNGGKFNTNQSKLTLSKGSKISIPSRKGYSLLGWSFDKNGQVELSNEKVQEELDNLKKDKEYYAVWDIDKLNREDHFAYIKGYEDGTVRAVNNITREEVSAIFYRLLNTDYRKEVLSLDNNFKDMTKNRWSNKEVSTLNKADILEGYLDGTFRPGNNITRAEAATIASRFDNLSGGKNNFTDIDSHWAKSYIISAAEKGWIKGYDDNTFRPDEFITRAEFITLVNGVLNRSVTKEYILSDIKTYKDLKDEQWYYENIIEATNGHIYERLEDGNEKWLELTDEFPN